MIVFHAKRRSDQKKRKHVERTSTAKTKGDRGSLGKIVVDSKRRKEKNRGNTAEVHARVAHPEPSQIYADTHTQTQTGTQRGESGGVARAEPNECAGTISTAKRRADTRHDAGKPPCRTSRPRADAVCHSARSARLTSDSALRRWAPASGTTGPAAESRDDAAARVKRRS